MDKEELLQNNAAITLFKDAIVGRYKKRDEAEAFIENNLGALDLDWELLDALEGAIRKFIANQNEHIRELQKYIAKVKDGDNGYDSSEPGHPDNPRTF